MRALFLFLTHTHQPWKSAQMQMRCPQLFHDRAPRRGVKAPLASLPSLAVRAIVAFFEFSLGPPPLTPRRADARCNK